MECSVFTFPEKGLISCYIHPLEQLRHQALLVLVAVVVVVVLGEAQPLNQGPREESRYQPC